MLECQKEDIVEKCRIRDWRARSSLLLVVLGTLLTTLSLSHHVCAEKLPTPTIDQILLSSDAIIFANIGSIDENSGSSGLVKVTLTDVDVISSRYALPEGQPVSILVTSEVSTVSSHWGDTDGAPSVKPKRHDSTMILGHRYLLFLRGGSDGPLLRISRAIFQVNSSGHVDCAGGEIFGVGSISLTCSVAEREFSPPLSEAQLKQELQESLVVAQARRPKLAVQEDAAGRDLFLNIPANADGGENDQ